MLAGLRSNLHDLAEARLDMAARAYLADPRIKTPDFSVPEGAPSFVGPDSVSWRIFKNPVTLFIGGVAAVFMEFADPRVRMGVWEHSNFRTDPVLRLKRTGLAAMITVYGPRAQSRRTRRVFRHVVGALLVQIFAQAFEEAADIGALGYSGAG